MIVTFFIYYSIMRTAMFYYTPLIEAEWNASTTEHQTSDKLPHCLGAFGF
jgi:hypothetical protein